jgi:hypothetical protein
MATAEGHTASRPVVRFGDCLRGAAEVRQCAQVSSENLRGFPEHEERISPNLTHLTIGVAAIE